MQKTHSLSQYFQVKMINLHNIFIHKEKRQGEEERVVFLLRRLKKWMPTLKTIRYSLFLRGVWQAFRLTLKLVTATRITVIINEVQRNIFSGQGAWLVISPVCTYTVIKKLKCIKISVLHLKIKHTQCALW